MGETTTTIIIHRLVEQLRIPISTRDIPPATSTTKLDFMTCSPFGRVGPAAASMVDDDDAGNVASISGRCMSYGLRREQGSGRGTVAKQLDIEYELYAQCP